MGKNSWKTHELLNGIFMGFFYEGCHFHL